MKTPLVAIIGLPNSGKSTLFNKILGRRAALTYPEAGTTRDRAYGLSDWNGLSFILIDTAGIDIRANSDLEKNVQKQTQIAKDEADLILLLVDGKTPLGSKDLQVGADLNRSGKVIVLAANKIDARNTKIEALASEYQKLGLGDPLLVSAVNGTGVGDLLDQVVEKLKAAGFGLQTDDNSGIRVAFVGKPNVGKSSLINALIKQERLLVHDQAGTTRSVVEIPFTHEGQDFILLDTAGIKKKWQQDSDVAAAAAFQSIRTITQTDVVFFVIDATTEITTQDQSISSDILDAGKAVVLILNKIDKLSKENQNKFVDNLPNYLPQMWYVPVIFTSATAGTGMDLLLKFAKDVLDTSKKQIDQTELDDFLQKILAENMPGKMEDQREPKIFSLRQIGILPPTFKLTVNFPAAIAESWKRWFEKQFRLKFGYEGTPVLMRYFRKV
ncbi:MAG: ribosome biogenesis GTPase Der [Candidatus Doudnabacteria bacterium RIFCSPHIGHO2_02_FULL_42_25]|uniref:GTPase Der n=1 Tax=Candidatus Doudnabacteria bacterium RIFCSPHIGHO2_01_FULL_41_86 TaxID=1817821 RepID=A0A1F5N9T3_9BACT|nr:MAG: ribosome biogenesis GTPase Der [Candidatus Doudnabacteria bacterium RIFCSPHIGHO2_01_FULL_41_86]OGE85438.1 MAG: ribosome biogenesis GTPase Der [Candidatus Doudnabacteria bacterium RIFCSPHIGHO2_12_FULL_42_22]OGE86976.1 MAG: ribosome biogenesis GTPase Der [Candidatus Doudnabacteria bacterium RIFCSPHIGHO2_02_FULL_42_25]OGE92575.1 MAG: ribosome biogenesis GTPase Der [Candidatus Doudnabacteria bacterium RIFCSPLOWO2_01_FULL_42_60]OGE93030.1 MAG: ribosome biogenesis GTPase Der [Candidatus Doudn